MFMKKANYFKFVLIATIFISSCKKYPEANPEAYGNWKYYTTNNSALTYDEINTIEIDDSNHVWIGTGKGISMFYP